MGISRNTLAAAVISLCLLAAACGGGDDGTGGDTTRPPITTTLAPTDLSTTAAPTNPTTPPATAPPSTTEPPPPESIGGPADPNVTNVPQGADRIYFAGSDTTSSVRENALGDEQVLYYDVYSPTGAPNGLTALYLHDGAIDSGYANSAASQNACRQLSELGAWCIAIEYRRGFAGFDPTPTTAIDVSATAGDRFRSALLGARNDALEAWFHIDNAADTLGIPRNYLLVGEGSGALLASDIGLATPGLPYQIAGLVAASGTHEAGKPLVGTPEFPVVLQTGLFDEVHPAYLGRIYLDNDMPVIIGARTLFDMLAEAGATVRLFINAQEGHGLHSYRIGDQITLLPLAVQLALDDTASGAVIEYSFSCDDANFGAAGPGVVVNTNQVPTFSYEPYESDLSSGLSPAQALELHPLETTNCL